MNITIEPGRGGSLPELNELLNQCKQLSKQGKDTLEVKQKIQLFHLDQAKEAPYEVIAAVSSSNDCCQKCKDLSEKEISLEEAYKQMPIPHPNCEREGGCRCRYVARAKRDENGSLILKK